MSGLYSHTTRATGTILTATIYNQDHQNHIDNQTPQMTDDYSVSAAEMRAVTNPGGVGTESLATSLSGELERLRYAIKALHGGAQWYSGGGGSSHFLGSFTVSAAAAQAFTTAAWFDGTYSELEFVLTNVSVATDADFWFRVSTDGGSTWKSGAAAYLPILWTIDSASGTGVLTGGRTKGLIGSNVESAPTHSHSFSVRLLNKPNQALKHNFWIESKFEGNTGNVLMYVGSMEYQTAEAINAMQFSSDAATYSAIIRVYGRPTV